MKGVILAGGMGTRLYPTTISTNKHLLPLYDKPLIYYPLSNLLLAGCTEILIISNPENIDLFENLIGNGERFGIEIKYKKQNKPDGIPSALNLAKKFTNGDDFWLTLGDNLIFGSRINEKYKNASDSNNATVFLKFVGDTTGLGVAKLEKDKITELVEKPKINSSGWVVTGLYRFPNNVFDFIDSLKPSKRNETEIIDLLNIYKESDNLDYQILGRGVTWIDCGTNEDLIRAGNLIHNYQIINNTLICSPEEIALNLNLINISKFKQSIKFYKNSDYGRKLEQILN